MPSEIQISVCIANYNGIDLIDACITSVLKQTIEASIEIIVHDDASTDGSAEYIHRHYPDVKLIESRENVGFCIANNRMCALARGEFLLLLNNDAVLRPDALATLWSEARRTEQPSILSLPQFDALTGDLVDRGYLLDLFYNPVPNLSPEREVVSMVIGACLWIPKALWEEVGGFPEWFSSIAEDMYLCCRARYQGYTVRVSRASGYLHHQGKSFGGNRASKGKLSTTYRRRQLSERNKTFVMLMVSPAWQLLPTLPLHFLLLTLEGLAITLIRRETKVWSTVYWPVFRAIWRARHELVKTRRQIQAERQIGWRVWLAGFVIFPRKLAMLLKYGLPTIR